MENIGKICTGIILIMSAFLIKGFVVLKIWDWILVPIFDIKPLSFSQSIGIALILFFMKPVVRNKNPDFKIMFENFLFECLYTLTILLSAFVISIFI